MFSYYVDMQEKFRDVIGFEEYFQISNLGNVFSKRSNRLLKLTVSKTGYYVFTTRIGGRSGKVVAFRVHRLVAEAFLPPPTEDQLLTASNTKYGKVLVNHIDGNKQNNCVSNLEWCTHSENTKHAINTGLIINKKSEEHGTTTQYRYGCRCDLCKHAYSIKRKERYERLGT